MNNVVKFRCIKREIRILGIDDSKFHPRKNQSAIILGVVFRGGLWLDGIMKSLIEVDGLDVTEKIVEMIKASPHYQQLRVIMLNGITFAGFNIIHISKVFTLTDLPVIVITREKPNLIDLKNALTNLPNTEQRWNAVQAAGNIYPIKVRESVLNVQFCGLTREDVEKIIYISSTRENRPEPLRVAQIIASGLSAYTTRKTFKL